MGAEEQTIVAKRGISAQKLCRMLLIFLVGCFAGWLYEEIFYWITEGLLRNRGVLYGPWLPIYGTGTLGIYQLKPWRKRPVLVFALCVVITGVVEYIVGLVALEIFGLRLWDYRGLFLSIGGLVCLRSVVSFGVLGLVFLYLVEPVLAWVLKRLPVRALYVLCGALAAIFLTDCALSALFRTPITY